MPAFLFGQASSQEPIPNIGAGEPPRFLILDDLHGQSGRGGIITPQQKGLRQVEIWLLVCRMPLFTTDESAATVLRSSRAEASLTDGPRLRAIADTMIIPVASLFLEEQIGEAACRQIQPMGCGQDYGDRLQVVSVQC